MTSSLLPTSAHYDLAQRLHQSGSRRNGKVARLPFELRQQVNRMLENGVPYKTIIQKLGPAGQHLTEHNLSNWRLGGYQDYLNAQTINDRAHVQTLAAADVLRELGQPDPEQLQKACNQIVLVQYMNALMENGDQWARDTLQKNPAKMITLINACCNSSNTTLADLKRKDQASVAPNRT